MEMEIEKDELFSLAEKYVNDTGMSVFLTGKAGTGKTTFLKHITQNCGKRLVVLAPTGVAAINAGGSTIHSFFQLPLCPYLPDVKELVTEYQMPEKYRNLRKERVKIIRTLDLLIIDEISMVRADLLDAVDAVLRRYRHSDKPFGGVQLLMIGDAQQLSPVVKDDERPYISQVYPSPYFFHSKALRQLRYITIELRKVHRQKDSEFLEILNAIRTNRVNAAILNRLNSRVGAPLPKLEGGSEPIRLTTHNRQADGINSRKMDELPGEAVSFGAEIEGEFPENSYPVEEVLTLKKGAQVMFTRNDSCGNYYNGKLAVVESITKDGAVTVTDSDGAPVAVEPATWENTQYALDEESGEICQTVIGTFKQLPLKTAWAITIHKSQGLTFDNVIIDAGDAFAFGQVYVALSRCRTLDGIVLERPVYASSIYSDADVAGFNESIPSEDTVRDHLDGEMTHFRFDLLQELFSFEQAGKTLAWLNRLWTNQLEKSYPTLGQAISRSLRKLDDAKDVATKFRSQLSHIEKAGSGNEDFLDERLKKASAYFLPIFEDIAAACAEAGTIEIDNREVKKQVKEAADELMVQMEIVCQSLEMIRDKGFSTDGYKRIRTACLVEGRKVAKARRLKKMEKAPGEAGSVNEELRNRLTEWRTRKFKEENVPAYRILMQSTLLDIAQHIPATRAELLAIKGFGKSSLEKYGDEILEMCREYQK